MRRPMPVKLARFPPWARFSCVGRARAARRGSRSLCPRPWILLRSRRRDVARWPGGDDGAGRSLLTIEKEREPSRLRELPRVRHDWPTIGRWRSRGLLRGGGWRVRAGATSTPSSNAREREDRALVVDWKSGRPVTRQTKAGEAGLFCDAAAPVPAWALRGRRSRSARWSRSLAGAVALHAGVSERISGGGARQAGRGREGGLS